MMVAAIRQPGIMPAVNMSPTDSWVKRAYIMKGMEGGMMTPRPPAVATMAAEKPTEAACVSVFYALIVCLFIYRTISIKDVPQLLKDAIASYAPICFLIGRPQTGSCRKAG